MDIVVEVSAMGATMIAIPEGRGDERRAVIGRRCLSSPVDVMSNTDDVLATPTAGVVAAATVARTVGVTVAVGETRR